MVWKDIRAIVDKCSHSSRRTCSLSPPPLEFHLCGLLVTGVAIPCLLCSAKPVVEHPFSRVISESRVWSQEVLAKLESLVSNQRARQYSISAWKLPNTRMLELIFL
ncbi:hypothetical protein HPB48_017854 [Haemaphysalis longicornis]|uniref:Uncharacterized protein n=1 Tax=Haemaphysalis longicornis TaxID=44386 RepID=A0A9J6GB57_HAELO|nr:hypothetical protein HPB48_017854 [Haemaphysalis longicornis]